MKEKILASEENGNRKVKIIEKNGGIYLFTTRNGYQWSTAQVDDEIMRMIKRVIFIYLTDRYLTD